MIDASEARQLSRGYGWILAKIENMIRADARAHHPRYETVIKIEDHIRHDLVNYLTSLGYDMETDICGDEQSVRISWRYR
jgi:hypothetical protein